VASAAVAVVAGAVAVIAMQPWAEPRSTSPKAVERLWPRVPDVSGLAVPAALRRVEAAGWRPVSDAASSVHGKYAFHGWIDGTEGGTVRPTWGRIVCGAKISSEYRLTIAVAKKTTDCDVLSQPLPPFMAFRWAHGWVAAWAGDTVELWSPRRGFRRFLGDIRGGTCGRPARSRAYHTRSSEGFDIATLRRSTWNLHTRSVCISHRGGDDLVANDEPARDTTLRRRRSPSGLDIDFAYDDGASGAPFHATVRRARHGAATTVTVNGPAAEGSGDIFAHVRPGRSHVLELHR
jgi:hypothetical protein